MRLATLLARALVGACLSLTLLPTAASAQDSPFLRGPLRPVPTPQLYQLTSNRIPFDPDTQGFRFANTFSTNFLSEIDFRTDGLCGGMVFAVLDYLANPDVPMPTQDYPPAEGTVLREYIVSRQMNSMWDTNFTRWVDQLVNPFGSRNDEFYRWGLQDRLTELRREIDAGRMVPMALKGCDEGCAGDHVVLAVGYDIGGYRGDPNINANEVRITIYDPNFPGQLRTLSPDPVDRVYRTWGPERGSARTGPYWRTWFPMRYSPARPPVIAAPANRQVVITMRTGGDDLRGGNDNLAVLLVLPDHRTVRFNNVNEGHRWINNSNHTVALTLPDDVPVSDLRGVRLETNFSGGHASDNWNMDWIRVEYRDGEGAGLRELFSNRPGRGEPVPLTRFSGEHRSETFLF